jgi:AcrR family transcriptional regulator
MSPQKILRLQAGAMTAARSSSRPLRADAARNQARILEAARVVFGARGLDVPLDDIAHHAGVGVATLYRRFPDRGSLVTALFEQEIRCTAERARAALSAADPWEGFTTLLRSMFRAVAEDRGMRQALLSSRHGLGAASSGREELISLLTMVVQRAQQHGSLRAGVAAQDIPPMMLMVGVVADFASSANPRLWERYGTLLIDGLSTRGRQSALLPDALSESELALASSQW